LKVQVISEYSIEILFDHYYVINYTLPIIRFVPAEIRKIISNSKKNVKQMCIQIIGVVKLNKKIYPTYDYLYEPVSKACKDPKVTMKQLDAAIKQSQMMSVER